MHSLCKYSFMPGPRELELHLDGDDGRQPAATVSDYSHYSAKLDFSYFCWQRDTLESGELSVTVIMVVRGKAS